MQLSTPTAPWQRTLATVLFLAVVPTALLWGAYSGINALHNLEPSWEYQELLAVFVAMVPIAGLLGWWWGRWSVLTGPFTLAVALTLAVTAAMLLLARAPFEELLTGIAAWPPGLLLVLILVAVMARRGRVVLALVLGAVLWLIVLDVAVAVDFLTRLGNTPPPSRPDDVYVAAHSPMYFVYALTDYSFGVMNRHEEFEVGDDTVGMPHALILLGSYAMAFAAKAVSPQRRASSASSIVNAPA